MTWKEFKDALEAAGVKNDSELYYIDTGNNPDEKRINVTVEENKDGSSKFSVDF